MFTGPYPPLASRDPPRGRVAKPDDLSESVGLNDGEGYGEESLNQQFILNAIDSGLKTQQLYKQF